MKQNGVLTNQVQSWELSIRTLKDFKCSFSILKFKIAWRRSITAQILCAESLNFSLAISKCEKLNFRFDPICNKLCGISS
jgi:hypothetical protein